MTAVSPLRIKLDGDTAAIPATPDSLTDPATLVVDDRVRTELSGNRLVVLGRVGGLVLSDASTSVKGIVELATDAETITGTDAVSAVTPASLAATFASRLLLQSGYVYRTGNGSDEMDMPEVTFETAYAAGTFPTIIHSAHGYKAGTGDYDPDQFAPGASEVLNPTQIQSMSPTAFTVSMARASGGFSTGGRYMVAWMAFGVRA